VGGKKKKVEGSPRAFFRERLPGEVLTGKRDLASVHLASSRETFLYLGPHTLGKVLNMPDGSDVEKI
jgi:hypothetical protein